MTNRGKTHGFSRGMKASLIFNDLLPLNHENCKQIIQIQILSNG